MVRLLQDLDRLYEAVVTDPDAWDDQAFADWLDGALGDGEALDREALKIVRRAVRRAQRLQRAWADRPDGPADWRMRVDETLGSAGWRPGLELAEWGLAADPDPDLYAEYADRFRAVNFTPVIADFEEWLEGR
ncbi:MAG: hypothetical protein KJO17_14010 [Acidimicrobiia bacterium]|nr:hypothetical protein [Acidimicrobiia bacterium]